MPTRSPSYQKFTDVVSIGAPREAVFDFYASLDGLQKMLIPQLGVRVVRADLPLREGSQVEFEISPSGFPIRVSWVSGITLFRRPEVFEDRMVRGPFQYWVHRHEFKALADGKTEVVDQLEFDAPMGMLGRMASSLLLAEKIEELFRHRKEMLKRQFGADAVT